MGEEGPGRAVVLVIKEHDKDQGRRRELMDEPAELSNGGSNPRSSASTELGQGITSEMVTGALILCSGDRELSSILNSLQCGRMSAVKPQGPGKY